MVPLHSPVAGNDLRELRREQEDVEGNDTGPAALTAAVLDSAGVTVLSRFMSRSTAALL